MKSTLRTTPMRTRQDPFTNSAISDAVIAARKMRQDTKIPRARIMKRILKRIKHEKEKVNIKFSTEAAKDLEQAGLVKVDEKAPESEAKLT